MSSLAPAISSLLFFGRNGFVAASEDKFKEPQMVGQAGNFGKNLAEHLAKYDNAAGKTARTAVDALKMAAESDKVIGYAGKTLDFAMRYVNPLICVSAGIDILRSKDPKTTSIIDLTALACMFGGEYWFNHYAKEILKVKGIDKIAEGIMKCKHGDKIAEIIRGVAFVLTSYASYNVGKKFGTMVARTVKEPEQEEKQAA